MGVRYFFISLVKLKIETMETIIIIFIAALWVIMLINAIGPN